jgi:hypothetical protein
MFRGLFRDLREAGVVVVFGYFGSEFGTTLERLWNDFGTSLERVWNNPILIINDLTINFGTVLERLWNEFGTPMGILEKWK